MKPRVTGCYVPLHQSLPVLDSYGPQAGGPIQSSTSNEFSGEVIRHPVPNELEALTMLAAWGWEKALAG